MEWQYPQAFYFILPLVAVWVGLSLFARARRRAAARAFVSAAMAPRILPAESPERFWVKTALGSLAIVFALLALARPSWGSYYEPVQARGSDLYVLIDVSKSMLATDVFPNRLERAKSDVSSLLNRLDKERVGLIAFAGKAAIKCPLTIDYDYFRINLNALDPNSAPRGGTAIGDAIRKALDVMPKDTERDQAILLITDGDDQESYPEEAAALAAQRRVTIFAMGLGDADAGAMIKSESGEEHKSVLNTALLESIALKTKGAFIRAGTKAYDLGTLYEERLSQLKGGGMEQRRVRKVEQFQIFLALAILCLFAERLIRPYPPSQQVWEDPVKTAKKSSKTPTTEPPPAPTNPPAPKASVSTVTATLLLLGLFAVPARAESTALVRDGVKLFGDGDLAGALEKFSEADEYQIPEAADAILAFDLGCVLHRKGEREKAAEKYMEAGLARDNRIAGAAQFNHGCLIAEEARELATERPEEVKPEDREKIVEKLKMAVSHFRTCLDLQPGHAEARKNIELIRLWIKFYTDRWREIDKQKRRDETNLLQFIEWLILAEKAIRSNVRELKPMSSLDTYAELKRMQEELLEEIGPLKAKIQKDVTPPPGGKGEPTKEEKEKFEKALEMLAGIADEAGKKMRLAAGRLGARKAEDAAKEQKSAVDSLERIWDAGVPFQALLGRDIKDEMAIVETLKADASDEKPDDKKPSETKPVDPKKKDEQTADLWEYQEDTARRIALLKLKAEQELKALEQNPPAAPTPQPPPGPNGAPQGNAQDPEKVKEGLKKAVELAPKAFEKALSAADLLQKKDRKGALPEAEAAKKILEEIAEAQPKDKNQDQKKNDEKKDQQQDKKDSEQKDKKDQEKKDGEKDNQKKDEQKKEEQQEGEAQKVELTKEQAQELLRKAREREAERRKQKADEKSKLIGIMPGVDKDW